MLNLVLLCFKSECRLHNFVNEKKRKLMSSHCH